MTGSEEAARSLGDVGGERGWSSGSSSPLTRRGGASRDALLVQGCVQVLEDAGEGIFAGAGALNRSVPRETPQLG